MAQSSACRTFLQNPLLGGKNELAGTTPTKGNNTLAMSVAFTPAVAPPVISTLSSVAQYSEDDFQHIIRIILDFRPPAPPLTLVF